MRRKRIAAVLALAAALAAARAEATISTVEACTIYPDNHVVLARGDSTDVTVTGFGVDLATSVTTTVPGASLTIASRKNGTGSNIVLRFSPPLVGAGADGTVTLHYFGGATDAFRVTLLPGPGVTSIAFAPGPGVTVSGGVPRVTSLDPHVVVLKGTNLDSANLNAPGFEIRGLYDYKILLQLPGELHVSFKSYAGDRFFKQDIFQFIDFTPCPTPIAPFEFAFTVFDPPRTPTPTPTPRPALVDPHQPVATRPGAGLVLPPTATPTPTKTPLPLLPKR